MAYFRPPTPPPDLGNHTANSTTSSVTNTSSSTAATLRDLWSGADTDTDATSHTSRSSSIPWAAETVAEHRDLWLGIEAMLYGERQLPATGPLRHELQQWMRHQPHIRVRGTAIPFGWFVAPGARKRQESGREEVYAIHPAPMKAPTKSQHTHPNHSPAFSRTATSKSTTIAREAEEMLAHCLRISSSSWSRRPTTTAQPAVASWRRHWNPRQQPQLGPIDVEHLADGQRIHSVRSDIQRVQYEDDEDEADDDAVFNEVGRFAPHRQMPVMFRARSQLRPLAVSRRLPTVPFGRHFGGTLDQQQQRQWSPLGNAAIRKRTILPPIADLPTVSSRQMQAEGSGTETMGDLFGRSVSAIYVPPLNI